MHYGFTLNRHGDIIKVVVVGLVPCFKVPLRNTSQAIPVCNQPWTFKQSTSRVIQCRLSFKVCFSLLIGISYVKHSLTDVPLGYEINQTSPLDHLWFVLKVSEVVGDAAHQFKAWKPEVQELTTLQILTATCHKCNRDHQRTSQIMNISSSEHLLTCITYSIRWLWYDTWSESINPQEFYQLVQFGEVVLGSSSSVSTTTNPDSCNSSEGKLTKPATASLFFIVGKCFLFFLSTCYFTYCAVTSSNIQCILTCWIPPWGTEPT